MTLRPAWGVLMLIAALAPLISGCGSAAPTEDKNVKVLLLTVGDLPSGGKIAEPFPEPCSPIPTLEAGESRVAATKPLEFDSVVMREVLGSFPTEDDATSRYEDLTSSERAECIAVSIEELGEGERVETEPPASFGIAEEDSSQQFRSIGANSGTVHVVSLKSGQCVATMIFIDEGEAAAGIRKVSKTAADLIPDDC
jgi:hypothetical protein